MINKNALESILLVNTTESSYYLDVFCIENFYSITKGKPERGHGSKPVTIICCRALCPLTKWM